MCSRHFNEDCYTTEGQQYRSNFGIPVQKCFKPDTATVFPKSRTPVIVEVPLVHKVVLYLKEQSEGK